MEHLEHAVDLARGGLARGVLEGLEGAEVRQLLQVALVVLLLLLGHVGRLDGVGRRHLLGLVLLPAALLGGGLLGGLGGLLGGVGLDLGQAAGLLLLLPLDGGVEDGTLGRGHVAEDDGDGRLLLDGDDLGAGFLVEGLGDAIAVHQGALVDPVLIEGTELEDELGCGDQSSGVGGNNNNNNEQ